MFPVSNTTTQMTIVKLRKSFAKNILSDIGTQLISGEFQTFCNDRFKTGLRKALKDQKNKDVPMNATISRYLLTYITSIHCTTGEAPAKLM